MKPENVHKITIASPCSVPWDSMKGDDFIRHCGQCKLNVFNLSAMTLDEVASLLEKKEGRMCVRFFRREDGTILTQDCPVGLAAVRRRLMLLGGTLATALVAAVQWVGPSALIRSLRSSPVARIPGVTRVLGWLDRRQDLRPAPPRNSGWTAGEPVARPTRTPSPVEIRGEASVPIVPQQQRLVEQAGGIGPMPEYRPSPAISRQVVRKQ